MIRLNPRHDPDALAPIYAERKRLQVRDILIEADAERVLGALAGETPWGLVFNRDAQVVQLSPDQVAQLSPQQSRELMQEIHQRARGGYQFLYNAFPLYSAYFTPAAPRFPIFDVMEFVNSPGFLDFARRLTGLTDIRWADAHATQFRAGHFLKYHTDETPAEKRLAAYVLNFTKGWGRDWGGYLQFFNDKYDIEEGLRPVFNAINIFTIPMDHSVSIVANYAPTGRYAVTGWLRGDDPPGPFRF